jgi:DNA-binding MarR family transcriptional regulator
MQAPDGSPSVGQDEIEELRAQHIGRLFLRAHRDFSLRAIEKLRERGHGGFSLAHTNLLAQLDTTGTRLTSLAERLGITKQAVGSIVADLEASGYVARANDPLDRRATLVTYTDAGWRFLHDAYWVKREIEAEYTALLGERGMGELRSLLETLLSGGEVSPTSPS